MVVTVETPAASKTIRAEIREFVEEAKRRDKPITSEIIWGLLSREVPEDSCKNLLSMMVRSQQVVKREGTGRRPGFYEPGPVPARSNGTRQERFSMSMGFREHARLMAARKAAREWLRG